MRLNKLFFAFPVLIFSLLDLSAQDVEADPDISWYDNFFRDRKINIEKALSETDARRQEAGESEDLPTVARANKELGLLHLAHTRNYEKAVDFFIQALTIEDSLDLKKDQMLTWIAMAQVFEEIGNPYKSAEFLEEALAINRAVNHKPLLIFILNRIGKINAATGKMDEAFGAYEQMLDYAGDDHPRVEAEATFNLGHLYTLQGNFKEALAKHKRALVLRRSLGDRKGEALSLNDVGSLYLLMKNEERAMANHVAALEIRLSLKDQEGIATSYNNIGALYYHQKNIERAIANLELGLEASRESQAQDQMRKSYEYLSLCYEDLGDYKTALENKELFLAMSDFVQHDNSERQLLEAQNRYEVEQKQSQIKKLESIRAQREHELQEQKKFNNFLFALVALVLIIVVLVVYLYLVKRRSNKVLHVAHAKVQEQNVQLQDLNATKDKFFSIISHDLKGPLNSLTSFSGLLINHTDSLSKDEIRMLAKDLDKSLKNLFALLENLLEWSRSQTGNIEFKPEPFDLGALLESNRSLLQAQAQNKNITIENTNDTPVNISAHRHSVNTVVRNLISNAIKFTAPGGKITLGTQHKNEDVIVFIADTGVGMSAEVIQKLFRIDTKHSTKGTADEKGTGLGLILCKEFIEKNGGRIWVTSEAGKGSVFYFSLPASVPVGKLSPVLL